MHKILNSVVVWSTYAIFSIIVRVIFFRSFFRFLHLNEVSKSKCSISTACTLQQNHARQKKNKQQAINEEDDMIFFSLLVQLTFQTVGGKHFETGVYSYNKFIKKKIRFGYTYRLLGIKKIRNSTWSFIFFSFKNSISGFC